MEQFADGWVTDGWSKIDGVWIELGKAAGVSVIRWEGATPPPGPDLTIHQVADKLNTLEGALKATQQALLDAARAAGKDNVDAGS